MHTLCSLSKRREQWGVWMEHLAEKWDSFHTSAPPPRNSLSFSLAVKHGTVAQR